MVAWRGVMARGETKGKRALAKDKSRLILPRVSVARGHDLRKVMYAGPGDAAALCPLRRR